MNINRGVTIVELMIALAVVGITVVLGATGVKFVNGLSRQKVISESDRDAQLVLYQIARDIRSCESIYQINNQFKSVVFTGTPPAVNISVDQQRLILNGFDYSQTHDIRVNPNLFTPSLNGITISYEYKTAGSGYLERTYRVGTTTTTKQQFLAGALKPDSTTNAIFRPANEVSNSSFTAVEVFFRIQPAIVKNDAKIYSTVVGLRN